jgi:hypothetical protein
MRKRKVLLTLKICNFSSGDQGLQVIKREMAPLAWSYWSRTKASGEAGLLRLIFGE